LLLEDGLEAVVGTFGCLSCASHLGNSVREVSVVFDRFSTGKTQELGINADGRVCIVKYIYSIFFAVIKLRGRFLSFYPPSCCPTTPVLQSAFPYLYVLTRFSIISTTVIPSPD
jgi:hypothetical protein